MGRKLAGARLDYRGETIVCGAGTTEAQREDSVMTKYQTRVIKRGYVRYLMGLVARLRIRLRMNRMINALRKGGAIVGERNSLTRHCKMGGGHNLIIGNCCSFQDVEIDTRAPVKIGNHVIIGDRSRIITCSHDVDDPEWTFKQYGIEISDYVWIASNAIILPSCRYIGRGAVVGAGSVVAKDVPDMAIVVGNPATVLRYRKCVHGNLVSESMLGGDLAAYREARKLAVDSQLDPSQ